MGAESGSVSCLPERTAPAPACPVNGTGLLTHNSLSTHTFGALNGLGQAVKRVRQPNSVRQRAQTRVPNFQRMVERLSSIRSVLEAAKSGCVTVMDRTPCRSRQWAALLLERRAGL